MKIIQLNPAKVKISFPGVTCKKVFNLEDILYFQALDNYTTLHTENEEFLISKTLKIIDEVLCKQGFIRCHKSFLVNIHYISVVTTSHQKEIILQNGKILPLSRAGYELLKTFI